MGVFKQGLVHVYCGDGQGKTSAAVGLAVRGCGAGARVLFTQFLKDCRSSELNALQLLAGGVEVLTPRPCVKFVFQMTEPERRQASEDQTACFREAVRRVSSGEYDLLVLDEAMDAVGMNLIDRAEFLEFMKSRPAGLEVAITGHGMIEGLAELADYISEVKKIKHPYDRGVRARLGAEL